MLILSSLSRYAFCRVADDLIDEDARTVEEGRSVLSHIRAFVNRFYSSEICVGHEGSQFDDLLAPLKLSVSQRRPFFALPRTRWPSQTSPSNTANSESLSSPPAEDPLREPLLELLDGFDTDLVFKELANDSDSAEGMERVLVRNNEDLERTLTHTSIISVILNQHIVIPSIRVPSSRHSCQDVLSDHFSLRPFLLYSALPSFRDPRCSSSNGDCASARKHRTGYRSG